MKKIFSLLLTIAILASMLTVFSVSTAAADNDSDMLTITCQGEELAQVKVGNAFIFYVGLNSGGYPVRSGQAEVHYDSKYVQVIEHGTVRSDGSINMDAYSFPASVRSMNLLTNFTGLKNEIRYNFYNANGDGVIFSDNDPYFKVRFKAIAPGKTEISHYFNNLSSYILVDNGEGKTYREIRLIFENRQNEQLDPIPYALFEVDPAERHVGDADGDGEVTILDATLIQKITAGENLNYNSMNADVNNDGELNLKDVLNILRYKAGISVSGKIGEWIFPSEQ